MDEDRRAVIPEFRDEFRFLSNFHSSTITFGGMRYPTVEHAYQAAKSLDPDVRLMIKNAKTPGKAKRLGRCVEMRPDWDEVKVEIMLNLVRKKFENPFLRPMLLATDDAELIEGNHHNDRFWGTVDGVGQNVLGKILMRVREEIRSEDQ